MRYIHNLVDHAHLRVGDITAAESFLHDDVGFDRVSTLPGARFVSTGHYHHHVAMNVWQSAVSARRTGNRTGLAWFEVLDRRPGATPHTLADPWDIKLRTTPAG